MYRSHLLDCYLFTSYALGVILYGFVYQMTPVVYYHTDYTFEKGMFILFFFWGGG